jgi:hypothetical protein
MNQTPAAGAFPKLALKSDSWRNIPISLKALDERNRLLATVEQFEQ